MAKISAIDKAFIRVGIIKAIVRAERRRAESDPKSERNIEFGVIEVGLQKQEAQAQIAESFNDIELFLDHLHVAHLAAAFESMAKARLGAVIGESRKAIRSARKSRSTWPEHLVRNLGSVSGLKDLSDLLPMSSQALADFDNLRVCRNDFDHGSETGAMPSLSSGEAYDLLREIISNVI